MSEAIKFLLPDDRIPKAWYNIVADLPQPLPLVLNSATGKPVGPEDLAPLFPMSLILQEGLRPNVRSRFPVRCAMSTGYGVRRHCAGRGRPRPPADTPARIFYKDETAAPTGSFKPNELVAQAFYSREAGAKKIVSFTGAGQWGSALAFAGKRFGLRKVKVFMVKVSYDQKPYRRVLMETYGATCNPSPSTETEAGRRALAADPASPGSIGIAVAEAFEVAATDPDAHFATASGS